VAADLERLQKKFFTSTDQLVTLRMFSGMDRENWALARRSASGSRRSRTPPARSSTVLEREADSA
jgi:hypothetical protein